MYFKTNNVYTYMYIVDCLHEMCQQVERGIAPVHAQPVTIKPGD